MQENELASLKGIYIKNIPQYLEYVYRLPRNCAYRGVSDKKYLPLSGIGRINYFSREKVILQESNMMDDFCKKNHSV